MKTLGTFLERRHNSKTLQLHFMLIPGVLFTLVYSYGPMLGSIMAFQRFEPILSFARSEWVGWDNFTYVFQFPDFMQVISNTLIIATMKLLLSLLIPLMLALLLNDLVNETAKRFIQTSVFFPFFLSWTVLGGVIFELFSYRGPINELLGAVGGHPHLFFGSNGWFRAIIIGSDVWKGMGYNMIIYLAAITGINASLYEAAEMDGAGKWRQLFHITLPGIAPIVVMMSTLALGSVLNAGFEQILLLYNPVVYEGSDIIDTYVYRLGLFSQQFGPAAAIGLFKSVIALVMVSTSYYAAYRISNYRIF